MAVDMIARAMAGKAVNRIENTVSTAEQELTNTEKEQARENIEAFTLKEYDSSATSYEPNILYYTIED